MVYLLGSLLWFPCCISRKASPLHLAVLFLCSPCFPYAFDMLLMHQSPIHLPCFCYAAMLLAIHFLCSYALPDSAIHLPCSHAFARLCPTFPELCHAFTMHLRCFCDASAMLLWCFRAAFHESAELPAMLLWCLLWIRRASQCFPAACDALLFACVGSHWHHFTFRHYFSHTAEVHRCYETIIKTLPTATRTLLESEKYEWISGPRSCCNGSQTYLGR